MKNILLLTLAAAMFVPCAFAAPSTPVTSKVLVTVGPEAGLTIGGDATLASVGTLFANYTGTTNFTYFVRTGATAGSITMAVTTDFSTGSGPSVANEGTSGDTLTYIPTVILPATAASSTTALMTTSTSVASIAASSSSAKTGNSGSVAWTLINDPAYAVGSYSAVVTWTISAT